MKLIVFNFENVNIVLIIWNIWRNKNYINNIKLVNNNYFIK